MYKPTVGIIGSGIAGLASSVRMAALGYEVHVYEANSYPGGKLTELKLGSYRFDAGPSLFTLPEEIDALFEEVGEDPKQFFEYQKLSIITKYFFEDKTTLTATSDVVAFAKEIKEKLGVPERSVLEFIQKSKKIYEITTDVFLKKSLHKLDTYLSKTTLKAMMKLHQIGLFDTMNGSNRKQFKNEKLVQLFNRYATYNGSDPYQTPATMNVIPHLEFGKGAFFPKGGMHSITKSMYQLALRLGVIFHFNEPVKEIILERNKVKGIRLKDKEVNYDFVICNMDVNNAYRRKLINKRPPKIYLNQPKSSSAVIFYWGISRGFPELDLHNIFFSEDYKKEFKYIFKSQSVTNDPTVYVNISSKLNKEDAPPKCENWFVMVNTPHNEGQDWDVIIEKVRRNTIKKLSRVLNVDLEKHIEVEEELDPRSIEAKTSSFGGALYGNSSNNRIAAFLRHPNFSSRIKNLYFCGGSVHPGGGIPLCLLSARIVQDLVKKGFARKL